MYIIGFLFTNENSNQLDQEKREFSTFKDCLYLLNDVLNNEEFIDRELKEVCIAKGKRGMRFIITGKIDEKGRHWRIIRRSDIKEIAKLHKEFFEFMYEHTMYINSDIRF